MRTVFLVSAYAFVRNVLGIMSKPYEAYRRIVEKGSLWEGIPLGILLSSYFGIASLVKNPAFRPFLLTRHFVKLFFAAFVTFLFMTILLWATGKVFGGKGAYRKVALAWGYTLIPTFVWFLFTSLLYVVLPPPRTTQWMGILFSVFYLTVSSIMLLWKIMLSYLTLRFGLRLDLLKILIVALVVSPIIGFYCFLMYRIGIFKVPFL